MLEIFCEIDGVDVKIYKEDKNNKSTILWLFDTLKSN